MVGAHFERGFDCAIRDGNASRTVCRERAKRQFGDLTCAHYNDIAIFESIRRRRSRIYGRGAEAGGLKSSPHNPTRSLAGAHRALECQLQHRRCSVHSNRLTERTGDLRDNLRLAKHY